jgi:hypothetical protein
LIVRIPRKGPFDRDHRAILGKPWWKQFHQPSGNDFAMPICSARENHGDLSPHVTPSNVYKNQTEWHPSGSGGVTAERGAVLRLCRQHFLLILYFMLTTSPVLRSIDFVFGCRARPRHRSAVVNPRRQQIAEAFEKAEPSVNPTWQGIVVDLRE